MEIVASKKKRYYILFFVIALALAIIAICIYFFINIGVSSSNSYKVDKYSEVTDWCDTNLEGENLSIECKALLINIDIEGCFEVQVITQDKGLENLTICESNETLSYTNEILMYKKLMPIEIKFLYIREGIKNYYSFNHVTFGEMARTDIQNIVNADIADLVTIDPNSTTIQNSVDFCPQLEKLPEYVTTENKANYSKYKNDGEMKKSKYTNNILSENADNITINETFLICDSNFAMNFNACSNNLSPNSSALPKEINSLKFNSSSISWVNDLDEANIAQLNRASIIYDGLLQRNSITYEMIYDFNSYIGNLSSLTNPNEMNICIAYKVLNIISGLRPQVKQDMSYISNLVDGNILNVTSSTCAYILKGETVDATGLYLKIYNANISESPFQIFERCNNLNLLFK